MSTYEYWIAKIEQDPFGALPVGLITSQQIRAWAERQTLSPTNLRKRIGFIHQMLRTAGNHNRYQPPRKERHTRRPLSPEEVAKLMEVARNHTHSDALTAVLLCIECGLRRSEAVGLRHEDRSGDGILIRRSVTKVVGSVRVRGKTKTAKSHGWIPLPPSLLGVIGTGTGYVLGDGKRPMYPDVFTKLIRRIFEKAEITAVPHFGPHALRRTYGMTLLEAGVDIVTAADLMRHDPNMLMSEYARTRNDLKQEAVNKAFGTPKPDNKHHDRPA